MRICVNVREYHLFPFTFSSKKLQSNFNFKLEINLQVKLHFRYYLYFLELRMQRTSKIILLHYNRGMIWGLPLRYKVLYFYICIPKKYNLTQTYFCFKIRFYLDNIFRGRNLSPAHVLCNVKRESPCITPYLQCNNFAMILSFTVVYFHIMSEEKNSFTSSKKTFNNPYILFKKKIGNYLYLIEQYFSFKNLYFNCDTMIFIEL